MKLNRQSFRHPGLAAVHFGGSDPGIPQGLHGRCQRLTDSIESASAADDLDLPGNGYLQAGPAHSVDVDGHHRITYAWSNGHAQEIDFT
jgi:plasmid maintenance system killer protein